MGVRENLGNFFVSFAGEITYDYDTGTLSLPKNNDFIDQKFSELKDALINQIYPDYATYESDENGERVKVKFSDVGTEYIFENSSAGLLFRVRQPLYKENFADFRERVYIVVPRFDVDSISYEPAVNLKANFGVDYRCVICSMVPYAISGASGSVELKDAVLSKDNLIQPITQVLKSNFKQHIVDINGCRYSYATSYDGNVFVRMFTDAETPTTIKAKFNSSLRLSFFDRLINIEYNYRLRGDYSYSFKIESFFAFSGEIPDEGVTEDNYQQLLNDGVLHRINETPFIFKATAREEIDINEQEISFEVDSYVGFDFAKFLESLSSIKPEYKVEYPTDKVEELNSKYAGKSVFVVYPELNTYDVRTFIKAETVEDTNGSYTKITLDNFPKYDAVNNLSFIIWGIGGDAAYQPLINYKNESYFYKVNPDGSITEGADYLLNKRYYLELNYKGSKFGVCFYIKDILMLSGKSLYEINELSIADNQNASDAMPTLSVLSKVNVKPFASPILVSLPFIHISKEDYDNMNTQFDFLDFNKIPDMEGIGATKPLLVAMPHPSGEGYIIPVRLPNFVATKVKDYLGYSPSTLLINSTPDMAVDDEAFIAVRVFEKYGHDVYLIIGSIKSAGKPFKVMTFDNEG